MSVGGGCEWMGVSGECEWMGVGVGVNGWV